jgi:hypothetical protein
MSDHPREKSDFEQALDNLDPSAEPDQSGTTSQGWDADDTERRRNFEELHGVPDGEFAEPDAQPTDPNAAAT